MLLNVKKGKNHGDLQETENSWYRHATTDDEKRSRKCVHGRGVNRTIHRPVNQWHQ